MSAEKPLQARLDGAVNPSAALVLDFYVAIGLIPSQHNAKPMLAADFAPGAEPPMRKGALFASPITVKLAES